MATHSQPGCFSMVPISVSSRFSRKSSHRGDVEEAAEGETKLSSVLRGGRSGVKPVHLVILVNGIAGSADNWKFAAEQFNKKLTDEVVVHCSSSNSAFKTFNGVDVMGERLADEVSEVVKNNPGVSKVSFVGHSLGGLTLRYAIGKLYDPPGGRSVRQEKSESSTTNSEKGRIKGITQSHATIAGLEPINFITLATPHLGCRGNQYLPFLFGFAALETIAPLVSHWFIGNTGKHLFLSDGDKDKKPLLQRMVTDCDEGKFLSALKSFKKRSAYANVCGDPSIRKAAEMPDPLHEGLDSKYSHVVREEDVPVVAKGSSENQNSKPEEISACDAAEEEMVAGLQQVPWWRVDVSFSKAKATYQAHNLIQVKTASAHGEGADVIEHIIDKHFSEYLVRDT
uniref:DUF676 domain-containing protein n=2 Tax=Physcomitrium patens TaxID=3218 RepID=A0A7I4E7S6_PHYPA